MRYGDDRRAAGGRSTVIRRAATTTVTAAAFAAALAAAAAPDTRPADSPASATAEAPATGPSPSAAPATTPATTRAAEPSPARLTLHPSAATRPALRYRLLPDLVNQVPGNAAPLYVLAGRLLPEWKAAEPFLRPTSGEFDYEETPAAGYPPDAAAKAMVLHADAFRYAEMGARRDRCRFDAGWREGAVGAEPFQYVYDMRHLGNLLGFRGRIEVARGDWAAAAGTARVRLAMSRHLLDEPFVVIDLVAGGFAEGALSGIVEDWVSRAGSPNLYWPLTALPQPFARPHGTPEWEYAWLAAAVPHLDPAVKGTLPADRWETLVREVVAFKHRTAESGKSRERRAPPPADLRPLVAELVGATRADAERHLLASGTSAEQLRAMPVEQVVGTFLVGQFREWDDAARTTWEMPYPRAMDALETAYAAFRQRHPRAALNPLVMLDSKDPLPPTGRVRGLLVQVDRRIAAMRVIETLRDDAARHGGKPPTRLEDVTDLPVPPDPATGRPFTYRLANGVAVLEGPPLKHRSAFTKVWYELTFAP